MRIIHIVSGKVWGGIETYVLELSKRQISEGHAVEIICTNRKHLYQNFRDIGAKVHTMPLHGHLAWISSHIIKRILRSNEAPTAIHMHKYEEAPLIMGALTRYDRSNIRLIFTCHTVNPANTDPITTSAYQRMNRLIFVSDKTRSTFLSSSPKVASGKLTVIHNSIVANPVPKTAGSSVDDRIRLLCLGRLSPEKGIDTLIASLTNLPNCNLTLCGTGRDEYVQLLKQQADEIGVSDRIRWIDFQSDVAPLVAKADIGIFPSRCEESFGLVLLDYMSHGIPVVSTNAGAQSEIITDSVDGFLVPPDNPEALADAIMRLAEDPELCRKMGENALRKFTQEFNYDDFYNKIMLTYSSDS